MTQRGAGILLHVSSLSGRHGIGDLGAGARAFADWLRAAGQRWWQMLPIHPVGRGESPYSGASAFAGEPMLISLDDLVEEGLLQASEVREAVVATAVDYDAARDLREKALRTAFGRYKPGRELAEYERETATWLEDHALFAAISRERGTGWTTWPSAVRTREPSALAQVRREAAPEIAFAKFQQLVFHRQWTRLRAYCKERGVGLIGDIPIFVAAESADVWAHPEYFSLDSVAGVPPDYFSETGQRWGNPHYRWHRLALDRYQWWVDRARTLLARFDLVRIDHFIGFVRAWHIPATEETAVHGAYKPGPGAALFEVMKAELGVAQLPFIAEDLGAVTPEVVALREQFDMPGMKVFQFGFGTDVQAKDFRPHRYIRNCVAYTGTHDNDTIAGWLDAHGPHAASKDDAAEGARAIEYLAGPGATSLGPQPHLEVIRSLYASVADTVIVPMQDVLGLPGDARMNSPGVADGNWSWRIPDGALQPELAGRLQKMAALYERHSEEN